VSCWGGHGICSVTTCCGRACGRPGSRSEPLPAPGLIATASWAGAGAH
jgi:hypothetical protein